MNPTEERLRRALQARADLYDDHALTPPLPETSRHSRWRRPVLAAAAAAAIVVAVSLVVAGTGDDDVQPAPGPTSTVPTSTVPTSTDPVGGAPGTATGDVDGDGVDDEVRLSGRRLVVELSTGGSATRRVPAGSQLIGLADVGADGLRVVVDHAVYRIVGDGSVDEVRLGSGLHELQWIDAGGRLLTGTSHTVAGEEYITAYRWTGRGPTLAPAADAMYCPSASGDLPERCGSDATFVGEAGDLPELQPAPYESIGPGEGEVISGVAGWRGVTARLEGSTSGEVLDGQVELVVGSARTAIPAGAGPRVVNGVFPTGDGIAFVVVQAIGDSVDHTFYRYDGSALTRIEEPAVDGLTMAGGGPAGGGPSTETFLGISGGFFALRSESGQDLYQQAVRWDLDGDRLVGEELGVVCLDTLVEALGVPGAYGRCSFD
ncbi:hypothetical protein [Nocardioides sambongensis]|uniref:hypothetical protein n=1 Tax=Nocardioides sambongensis TaxID=2589074 RepID=UPI0011288757|nr:hypothetical protein [Nocardioides sambongensis]